MALHGRAYFQTQFYHASAPHEELSGLGQLAGDNWDRFRSGGDECRIISLYFPADGSRISEILTKEIYYVLSCPSQFKYQYNQYIRAKFPRKAVHISIRNI